MSINQRTYAQFPHTEKVNDEQENDIGFIFSTEKFFIKKVVVKYNM